MGGVRLCRLGAIAGHEVFSLERHPVLDGDAAAEALHPLHVLLRDGLGMVEEPAQPLEGNLPVDRLEDIEEAGDRFVVGGVQPERPALRHQQADHLLQLRLHHRLRSGRGSRKSSKSAAEKTSISPAPFIL